MGMCGNYFTGFGENIEKRTGFLCSGKFHKNVKRHKNKTANKIQTKQKQNISIKKIRQIGTLFEMQKQPWILWPILKLLRLAIKNG